MAKFLLVYTGTAMSTPSEEEGKAIMDAWMAWFGGLGDAVVDPGNPTGLSAAVTSGGVSAGGPSGISGYTVVSAADLDAAAELAKGCPHLDVGGTVEVYETFDVM
jgi:hypothetical protein